MAKKKKKKKKQAKKNRKEVKIVQAKEKAPLDPWKLELIGLILLILAAILFLGFLGIAGTWGNSLASFIQSLFGWLSWGVMVLLIIIGSQFLFGKKRFLKIGLVLLGLFLVLIGAAAAVHLFFIKDPTALSQNKGGGYLGYGLAWPFYQIFGTWASLVIFLGFIIGGFILIFRTYKPPQEEEKTVEEPLKKNKPKIKLPQIKLKSSKTKEKKESLKPSASTSFSEIEVIKQTKLTPSTFPLNLLETSKSEAIAGDIEANKEIIKKTLENFGIPVEMGQTKVGPTVSQYTLKPKEGIKLSHITSLSNDLALSLARHPIRIEAPIPGKSLVGIEVPNQATSIVRLAEILSSNSFKQKTNNLTLCLGEDVAGNIYLDNLASLPHLLISGATGSGKTVFLNSVILTLLYQNSAQNLRFILVDPKRVELTLYKNLPHLLTPTLTHVDKTINAFKWLIREMEHRFEIMEQAKKRNIDDYNAQKGVEKLPYIVVIVDELADLMIAAPHEIEASIIRLTQMARATGIHLILATQRPSVDVITGLIKANITSRVAFSVASMADSRTVLDFSGAEKLVGRGDMLYISPKLSQPRRLQAPYVSDEEIKRVVHYLSQAQEGGEYIDLEEEARQEKEKNEDLQEDELLNQAREEVIRANRASATFLQRRLRIGYARAARLLDLLEEEGTIGPADGPRSRQVFKKD